LTETDKLEPVTKLETPGAVIRPSSTAGVVSSIAASVYDRELKKIKSSRHAMQQFIETQQRWLSKMRQEVNHMGSAKAVLY